MLEGLEGLQGCGDGHVHLGPSWRPGAFWGCYAGVCGAVCGPGGLRVPCAQFLGARSPPVGGEHQSEETGQLQGAGVQGDLGFKVPRWVTTQEPVTPGLWLPSALRGAH